MDINDQEPEDFQATADAAFARASDGYKFNGQKLHPFSVERQAAANRLGLLYGNISEDKVRKMKVKVPVEPKKGKKIAMRELTVVNYPGMFDDIILVLFLCACTPDEVTDSRGEEAEKNFWKKAYAWGEKQDIQLTNERYGEAYTVAFQILLDATKTRVDAFPKKGDKPTDDSGN